jgi:hypothetical protein
MSNPEQPGLKRRRLLQILQRHESPDERVLHDVLAVDDRSHEACAVTVQIGPQLAGQSEELRPAFLVEQGQSSAQAAASSIVTPAPPLSPKAKPSAYFGCSSTETTFSPNFRGGIGAPKRATNSSGFMPMACARIADPGAEDRLLRHDRLDANPEALFLRDTVGIFGHEPEHALGAPVAARHRRPVLCRAARYHENPASRFERLVERRLQPIEPGLNVVLSTRGEIRPAQLVQRSHRRRHAGVQR